MTIPVAPDPSASPATAGSAIAQDGVAAADPASAESTNAVLGMIAYGQLAAFSRLAADAALAPELSQRLRLSRLAGLALRRLDRVAERLEELGHDLEPVMAPFAGVLVEFDQRTAPGTWWERLLKGYVGYGVADDFSRIVAQRLDPDTRDMVVDVLADEAYAELVVDALAAAAAQDPTLASRLALWGRRLVGEALGVVQRVLADHPDLRGLLEVGTPGDAQQRLFSALTAEHSRRMERLGLTP
ncbi:MULTISPECIES: ferritin-like fold-containing protein [unclassified Actinotalea]|uniref:ferritin-like fold-containing protein n=1 Tax=unclassified Actinotalea TaxID=2638618 RepID=UPI0015F58181|nr:MULTISPECIES: ferritin-like fold-containing protein [unclassified Actinotalea]